MSSFIPESFAKKQLRVKKESDGVLHARKAKRDLLKQKRTDWLNRAQTYDENEKKRLVDRVQKFRDAKASGEFYIPPEAKVLFVVRTKGINKINPKVKSILRLLRLRQMNNGVFMKVNTATWQMLRRVEPYVTYGFPTRTSISQLIYKRGYGKMNRSRIPLTDNFMIENTLGKYNVTCIEDLIETIYNVGDNFKEANNFMWPFKLSTPRGGWVNKNHSFHNNGDWGHRENEINALIRRMN
jgi:large subunit ribosomal protein L7e|tara:strand:- start:1240 stop:1959 length:720 start_codon:yes stop_codon:yes gene_type:complete